MLRLYLLVLLLTVVVYCSEPCAYNICEKCNADSKCIWDKTFCRKKGSFLREWFTEKECPCKKCTDWYNKEKSGDMSWLARLNKEFKCPCRAYQTKSIIELLDHEVESDNPSHVTWVPDFSCRANGGPKCTLYHPGANGCLRSWGEDKSGAGQQCCYGKDGHLLTAGSKGAGTPDRQHSIWHMYGHWQIDVKPYEWCCVQCGKEKECNYYIKDLRKGNSSHCDGI